MKKEFCDRCGLEIEQPKEKTYIEELGESLSNLLSSFREPTNKLETIKITLFFDKRPYTQDVILCEECRKKFLTWLQEEKGVKA